MSLLSSISSAFGGNLGSNIATGFMQDYFNRKSSSRQHGYNIADWQRQNEYDLPINQMARLKEAGINPHLAYMKGGISNTSAQIHSTGVSAPQIAKFDDFLNIKQRMQDLNMRDAQIGLIRSQISEADSRIRETKERIKGLQKDNTRKEYENRILEDGSVFDSSGHMQIDSRDNAVTKVGKSMWNSILNFWNRK